MGRKLPLIRNGSGAAETPSAGRSGYDFAAVRERLANARGPEYWRSLEELADTPEFREHLQHEFPAEADTWPEGVDRRRFLQVMGASLALAGLTSCTRQPLEKIVPYVKQPEEIVPGRPLYFATAHTVQGYASGILVESHMGRPTKIEGNPDHPASLGATDHLAQASILDLYDPDRSQVLRHLGQIRTWNAFNLEMEAALRAQEAIEGAGLRILTGTTTSPTLGHQMQRLRERFPKAKWHQWEATGRDAARDAALATLGEPVETRYDFSAASIVVSLDSDFMASGPGHVRYARDFMGRRRVREGSQTMNRLYAIESTPTPTGSLADHRLALSTEELKAYAMGVAAEVRTHGAGVLPEYRDGRMGRLLRAMGLDLRTNARAGVVIAGDSAPKEVHALALSANAMLGNYGTTAFAIDSPEVEPTNQLSSLHELVGEMNAGAVDVLLILGGNPVYDAPADLDFASALRKVALRVHHSAYEDETSALCQWHLPRAHELEAWSDARAYDGTITIMQPLIEPLYRGRSIHEVLALVTGQEERNGYDIVRAYWQTQYPGEGFEPFWRRALHDGLVPNSASPTRRVTFQREIIISLCRDVLNDAEKRRARSNNLELQFRPDPNVLDGRFANNGWLQELPRPWTRLTWDNAALLSPAKAEELGVQNEEIVELRIHDRLLRAPAWILPGHPDSAVTVHLGHGRSRAGRVAEGVGFDAYPMRVAAHLSHQVGLTLRGTGSRQRLACTQDHQSMEGRHLVRSATLGDFRRHPEAMHEVGHHFPEGLSMYPEYEYSGHAWGLLVDLGACTGCNACVVACNSENNIPVVGKEQVIAGREMQWLRIDRYFEGSVDDPEIVQQPVLCMHCENAPCEVVCPVGATVHSDEGLNEMVYNRCVGTRYCSNNCPYKVRRFNFLQYSDEKTEVAKLGRNPDVSVRTRGVMEKCTYCVQRINQKRIQAKKEDRGLRDGEIVTACQQACPTSALVFGDINDPDSEISRLRSSPLHYSLLAELNTKPRTTYLARIRNVNPTVEGSSHGD